MALGATATRVWQQVLGQSLGLIGIGVAVGTMAALGAGRVLTAPCRRAARAAWMRRRLCVRSRAGAEEPATCVAPLAEAMLSAMTSRDAVGAANRTALGGVYRLGFTQ
jgi:hypothetical protein